jgi:tetratricopeptide (TPR) repeat protein
MLPEAAERLSEALDAVLTRETPPRDRYVIEAVRASVLAEASVENLNADVWAELYFQYELDLRRAGEEAPPSARALAVRAARARATITRTSAWDAVARRVPTKPETLVALRAIAAEAGHETLVDAVVSQGLRVSTNDTGMLEAGLREAHQRTSGEPRAFLAIADLFVQPLVAAADSEGFERLLAVVEELLPHDPDTRGRTEAWAGSHYKELRSPGKFLARIGDEPQPWEDALSDDVRIDFWTERSNALRLSGRPFEALDVAEEVVALIPSDDRRLVIARRNAAILHREIGAPDESARLLLDVLERVEDDESFRLETLDSLAVSYMALGNYGEALRALEDALGLARGPFAHRAPKLRIARASMLTLVGREAEAAAALIDEELDPYRDPIALLSAAAAWITLLTRDPALAPQDAIDRVLGGLDQVYEDAVERDDLIIVFGTLDVSATLSELTGDDDAESRWSDAAQARIDAGRRPDATHLVWLATHRYRQHEPADARTLLRNLPHALLDTVGSVRDVGAAAASMRRLLAPLDRLVQAAWTCPEAGLDDIRLVAELQRDGVSRAQLAGLRLAAPTAPVLADGLGEDVLGRLGQAVGPVAVIEFVRTPEAFACLLTELDADGEVRSRWLSAPEKDPWRVALRLRMKLANWHRGRPGDPLELPEWAALEAWLEDELSGVDASTPVAFVEIEELAGLPWHTAVGRRACTYLSGWSTLLELAERGVGGGPSAVGILHVPRFGEQAEVAGALAASAAAAETEARARRLGVFAATDVACDRDAFRRVMEGSDLALALCHGFVDAQGEVALMLASDGTLPLAASRRGRDLAATGHLVSWREAQTLARAPEVVLSAACSSGLSRITGLGERLGLFGGLKRRGTRAVVAPHWDVVAADVLPILDDVFVRLLRGTPLGEAVAGASLAAASNRPRWLAWSLALEGDWR